MSLFKLVGGGFLDISYALPQNCGNHPIWLAHMFQMGWFNHQLLLVFVHHQFRFVSPLFVECFFWYPSFCTVNCDNVFRMFSRKTTPLFFARFFWEHFFHPSVAMWLGSWNCGALSGLLKMVTVAIVWASKVGLQIGPPLRVGQDVFPRLGAICVYIFFILWYINMLYILDWIFIRRHMYKTYMRHKLYHCISGIYWGYAWYGSDVVYGQLFGCSLRVCEGC